MSFHSKLEIIYCILNLSNRLKTKGKDINKWDGIDRSFTNGI